MSVVSIFCDVPIQYAVDFYLTSIFYVRIYFQEDIRQNRKKEILSEICFRGLTVICQRTDVFSTPVLPSGAWKIPVILPKVQQAVLAKHAYTFDQTKSEWAEPAMSGHNVRTYQGNELTRISSGNSYSQSPQLADPLCACYSPL